MAVCRRYCVTLLIDLAFKPTIHGKATSFEKKDKDQNHHARRLMAPFPEK